MLHISTNIGQTLTIQGTAYTLLGTDQLNNGALVKVDRGEHPIAMWLFAGDEGAPLGRGAKLYLNQLYPEFRNSAKLSLDSPSRLDIKFP